MSRSYQKRPHAKVKDSEFKKIYNRKLRRTMSNDALPQWKSYKKLNESYDICDYSCDSSWEEFKKWDWVREKFNSEEEAKSYWKKSFRNKK